MTPQILSALFSVLSLIYASYLDSLPTEETTPEELKERSDNVNFYFLFGGATLILSFY